MDQIDINFNVFSDTPEGKDPDSHSPTLRKYHKALWSKPLPNGHMFELDLDTPKLLHHKSDIGEFFLSSDAIGHTYKNVKKMSHILDQLQSGELDSFFHLCTTIGGFIIFPSKEINIEFSAILFQISKLESAEPICINIIGSFLNLSLIHI